jgi:hypothetical protein
MSSTPTAHNKMQRSPASQVKISQFLRTIPAPREPDGDCFIVESGNKLPIGPSDSNVIHAASPKKYPVIYDDDDDDQPLAQAPAVRTSGHTVQQREGHGVDVQQSDHTQAASPTHQPPSTQHWTNKSVSSSKAKRKRKRKQTTSAASVNNSHQQNFYCTKLVSVHTENY